MFLSRLLGRARSPNRTNTAETRQASRRKFLAGGNSSMRPRALRMESLEDRALMAVLYVDNTPSPTAADFSASGGTQVSMAGVNPFATISDAVAAAMPGDTINVADGTYTEAGA